MFQLALIIGTYSYIIFFMGILNVLYKELVIIVTVVFILISAFVLRDKVRRSIRYLQTEFRLLQNNKIIMVLPVLWIVLVFINLIGALGPELAFDALWYHLTFPKIYLENHAIFHIPGGLLYYSDMPKLGELLFVGALALGNEITAKVFHLLFGLLICAVLYLYTRKQSSSLIAFIAVLIFYSNLVVAWESITAYIDLIRTFFELLALVAFLQWARVKNRYWLILCSFMLGLAIATKLLSLGTLAIISSMLFFILIMDKASIVDIIKKMLSFLLIALLIPLPWFIFSTIHTGNPVYPFFTSTYAVNPSTPNQLQFLTEIWNILLFSPDPVSPMYLIMLPVIVLYFSKFTKEQKLIAVFSLLSLIVWYFTPRTGGGRFLLPYLPAYSILCAVCIAYLLKQSLTIGKLLIGLVIVISITTAGYRFIANSKYVSVILNQETKSQFLANNLNFSFGDYYDTDGYFKKLLKHDDTVLLYGFHNLYYADFPYKHESWIKKGDSFTHIATQNAELPERFYEWNLVYENKTTNVKLYTNGDKIWSY